MSRLTREITESSVRPAAEVVNFNMASATALHEITRVVVDDEPCFSLTELNLPTQTGRGFSRFQLLRIVRLDSLVTAYLHLGPSSKFKQGQFFIPGGQVLPNGKGEAWHTVAELMEIADELRGKPALAVEPSDLRTAFQNKVEEKKRRRKNQSTFGRAALLVRSPI